MTYALVSRGRVLAFRNEVGKRSRYLLCRPLLCVAVVVNKRSTVALSNLFKLMLFALIH